MAGWPRRVETRHSRFARPEAVTPDATRIQRCRWYAEGQRNILFYERLPILGAEDHRMDVAAWLRGLGLERYAPAFRDNDVGGEVLPELTSDGPDQHRRGLGRASPQTPRRNCFAQ